MFPSGRSEVDEDGVGGEDEVDEEGGEGREEAGEAVQEEDRRRRTR